MSVVSLGEVADRVGFSRMTVFRVLRGVGRVKPETRCRILDMAREMGYPGLNRVVFTPAVRRRSADHFMRLLVPVFDNATLNSEYSEWFFKGWHPAYQKMQSLGVRSVEFWYAEGQGHAFFNKQPWKDLTIRASDIFLRELGFVDGEPTMAVPETGETLVKQP